MTKIMLVEDDKSLREIYGVRLIAEGYEIISAGDGEEALATAVKEKPDLILSDVMMPKISGFDMLDILRSTPETKNIKVIMMTALSSEDQRSRGETLGADRYLVKSQVGIEDVVRTVHDVLGDVPVSAAPAAQKFGNPVPTEVVEQSTPPDTQTPAPEIPTPQNPVAPVTPVPATPEPITPPTEPAPQITPDEPVNTPQSPIEPTPTPTVEPAEPIVTPPAPEPSPAPIVPEPAPQQPTDPTPMPTPPAPQPLQTTQPSTPPVSVPVTPAPQPATPPSHLPEPTAPFSTAAPASLGERVINPPEPAEQPKDIQSLISQELKLDDGSNTQPQPPTA